MPSHLEQIAVDVDKELEKWEMNHEAEYHAVKPSSGSAQLERCEGEGLRAALESQRANIVMKKFPDLSKRSGIFRAIGSPGSYIGGSLDQIIIPIRITKDGTYITTQYNLPGQSVSLGNAIFCAAGKPAFISDGVTFVAWFP